MAANRRVDDLTVTCRLTACTLGSAPGPTLGIEYGKPLPLPFSMSINFEILNARPSIRKLRFSLDTVAF